MGCAYASWFWAVRELRAHRRRGTRARKKSRTVIQVEAGRRVCAVVCGDGGKLDHMWAWGGADRSGRGHHRSRARQAGHPFYACQLFVESALSLKRWLLDKCDVPQINMSPCSGTHGQQSSTPAIESIVTPATTKLFSSSRRIRCALRLSVVLGLSPLTCHARRLRRVVYSHGRMATHTEGAEG